MRDGRGVRVAVARDDERGPTLGGAQPVDGTGQRVVGIDGDRRTQRSERGRDRDAVGRVDLEQVHDAAVHAREPCGDQRLRTARRIRGGGMQRLGACELSGPLRSEPARLLTDPLQPAVGAAQLRLGDVEHLGERRLTRIQAVDVIAQTVHVGREAIVALLQLTQARDDAVTLAHPLLDAACERDQVGAASGAALERDGAGARTVRAGVGVIVALALSRAQRLSGRVVSGGRVVDRGLQPWAVGLERVRLGAQHLPGALEQRLLRGLGEATPCRGDQLVRAAQPLPQT